MSILESVHIESGRAAGSNYIRVNGESAGPLVLVIPGNPGLCEYYDRFLTQLAVHLPKCEIVAASHLGFDGTFSTVQSLDAQVAHQLAVADIFSGSSDRKIIVLGHSVGAWISERVAQQLGSRTLFVGLLAPTVMDIALSDRGREFSYLARTRIGRWFVLLLGLLVSFIPAVIVHKIISQFVLKDCSPRAQRASADLVTNRKISRQLLAMAFEEMHRIGSELEPADIRGFWSAPTFPIWALFAEEDHWVSPSTRRELLEQRRPPQIDMRIDSHMNHAWCLHHSVHVAELVYNALAPTIAALD